MDSKVVCPANDLIYLLYFRRFLAFLGCLFLVSTSVQLKARICFFLFIFIVAFALREEQLMPSLFLKFDLKSVQQWRNLSIRVLVMLLELSVKHRSSTCVRIMEFMSAHQNDLICVFIKTRSKQTIQVSQMHLASNK